MHGVPLCWASLAASFRAMAGLECDVRVVEERPIWLNGGAIAQVCAGTGCRGRGEGRSTRRKLHYNID